MSDQQSQGQNASSSEGTSSAQQSQDGGNQGGNNTPANTTSHTNQGGPSGERTITQKDLNKAAGSAREEGKQVALREKAQELGYASVEEMENDLKEYQQAKTERMNELEKAQKDLEKVNTRVSALEQANQEILSKAQRVTLDSEARLMALSLDAKPERVDAVINLAHAEGFLKDVSVSDEFEVDKTALEKALKDVLGTYTEFVATGPPTIGNGGGTPPGEPPNPNPSPREMTREQREDIARRARAGERISLSSA